MLTSLGFTGLEAEAYLALLRDSPLTGYGVARVLRKPVANTYKALEALELKGAIVTESGERRLCRAIPPGELLDHLQRSFLAHRRRAETALGSWKESPSDDRIYQLASRAQVLERFRRMLQRAREVALIDIFPEPLGELRPEIEAAARRLKVAIKAYQPAAVKGAAVQINPRGQAALARWPGDWVNLVCDGRELLIALLSSEKVLHAIWSSSAYVSWAYHSSLHAEIAMAGVEQKIAAGATVAKIQAFLSDFERYVSLEARGYKFLQRGLRKASNTKRGRNG